MNLDEVRTLHQPAPDIRILQLDVLRGLFSILFGASAMLFLDESRLAGSGLEVVDHYYRRTLLLMLFGIIHAWVLLWPHDVLYAYAMLGMLLFPLRKLRPGLLALIGAVLQILFSLVWLRHYHYGPLEWGWRSLIYGQRQKFRKAVSAKG